MRRTPEQAAQIKEYDATRVYCCREDWEVAEVTSSRSSHVCLKDLGLDFMGNKVRARLECAHLLPHESTCAAWYGLLAWTILGIPGNLSDIQPNTRLSRLVNGVVEPFDANAKPPRKKRKRAQGRGKVEGEPPTPGSSIPPLTTS